MLLFVDESGHNKSGTPCEVLAGVAVAEDMLWNLVRAIRSAERDHFGNYLRDVYAGEMKAKKLLKPDRFYEAQRDVVIPTDDCAALANSLLRKGKAARGQATSNPTFLEIVAFSRKVLEFVHAVLDIAASFNVQVFASVVDQDAPKPEQGRLRKDYVYLYLDDLRGHFDRENEQE